MNEEISEFYEAIYLNDKNEILDEAMGLIRTAQQFSGSKRVMIESSSQSIERHENFIPDVRYRLLIEDTLSVLEICKNLLEKEDGIENEKEKISNYMDKIINEYVNLQEYLRKNNKEQLDRIEEKLDKSLLKKKKFF
jgi:predicted RNA-binding protein with EMAP domain